MLGKWQLRTAWALFAAIVVALIVTAFIEALLATALITLLALVMALIGVAWQVSDNRKRGRSALSYSYYERWSRAEMLHCREAVGDLLDLKGTTQAARWKAWSERDPVAWPLLKRLQAISVYAFFEELAGQYNRGELDNDAAAEYLGYQAIDLWERSAWFIGRFRQQNANFCNEWKHMIDAIREPLKLRREAGEAAAKGHTYKQALELDFNPQPLGLSDRDSP